MPLFIVGWGEMNRAVIAFSPVASTEEFVFHGAMNWGR